MNHSAIMALLGLLLCRSSVGDEVYRSNVSILISGWQTTTSLPSDLPSMTPTGAPSLSFSPSQSHSPSWSVIPSPLPTFDPSDSPTTQTPSGSPISMTPSTVPSPLCHDVATYRSPLNNFQCHDHAGTNCFRWRFLGLTADQVEGLIENCPVTCKIDCGTLYSFEVEFHFRLGNISNFLAPESTRVFQETSADYLTRFVQPKAFENQFVVHGVELLSQRLPEGSGRALRRKLLGYLDISVAFRGFAVGLNYAIVEALLLEGIESPGYAGALHLAGDGSLRRTSVSFDVDGTAKGEAQVISIETPLGTDSFTWVLVAISVVAVMVLGGAVFQYLVHRRNMKKRAYARGIDDDFPIEIDAVSPIASPIGNSSFDGFVHILSSCSPKSVCNEQGLDASPVTSASSTHTSESPDEFAPLRVEEHPLTGIIPLMIVYKGIDNGDESSDTSEVERIVPSRRVDAPPDFLEALYKHHKSDSLVDYSVYDGILGHSDDDGLRLQASSEDSVVSFDENADPRERVAGRGNVVVQNSPHQHSQERNRSPLRKIAHKSPSDHSIPVQPLLKPPPLSVRAATTGSIEDFIPPPMETVNSPFVHSEGSGSGNQGRLVQTIMGMSPRKLLKPPPTFGGTTATPESKVLFSRRRSKSSCSESSGEATRLSEDGEQHVFQAPRKGKLGLVIQCIDHNGPVVSQVKDYSPLLGQVLRGDRVLEIDNKSTIGMTLKDVTGILGGKIAQTNRWASVFRIVVRRPTSPAEKAEMLRQIDLTPEPAALLLSRSPAPFVARGLAPTPPRHPLLRSSSDPSAVERLFDRKE